MNSSEKHIIYTIGHSTHSLIEFVDMLKFFNIKVLADIRALPGSRKFPQFDQDKLSISLAENGIEYIHMPGLGGRRKTRKDTTNIRWRNTSFRGYADYMETEEFKIAVSELENIALNQTTSFMCSESVWWRCHRSMVSDSLKANNWSVLHIIALGKTQEHPYTSPARVVDGKVLYSDEN